MGKRGPRKRHGPREPNGRLQRPRKEKEPPAILDYTLVRRLGLDGKGELAIDLDKARLPEAGYVIGRLWLLGVITRRQHDAALKFGLAWRRWASLAGIAPHVLTQRAPGIKSEVSPATWRRAKTAFFEAARAAQRAPNQVETWRLLQLVLLEDAMPLAWRDGMEFRPALREGLRAMLTLLADHYGLPTEEPRRAAA